MTDTGEAAMEAGTRPVWPPCLHEAVGLLQRPVQGDGCEDLPQEPTAPQ